MTAEKKQAAVLKIEGGNAMERPYVICHILSSLNGKIAGPFMGTEANGTVAGECGRLRREMKGDAWLYGTVTTKEFVGEKKAGLQ